MRASVWPISLLIVGCAPSGQAPPLTVEVAGGESSVIESPSVVREAPERALAGHYAVSLSGTGDAGCSQTAVMSSINTKVVLDISGSGKATACRQRSFSMTMMSRGGSFHDAHREALDEQLGLRGTAAMVDDELFLDLRRDDSVCEHRLVVSGLSEPSEHVRLRCRMIEPGDDQTGPRIPKPVLGCRHVDASPAYADTAGLMVRLWEIGEGDWLFLGVDAGIIVEELSLGYANTGVRWRVPDTPIRLD